jgi:thiamine kinase-like enzyme
MPGEGTAQLIDRKEEAAIYKTIMEENICDNVVYIDPDSGYKITEFIEGASVCDPFDENDVKNVCRSLEHSMNGDLLWSMLLIYLGRLISMKNCVWGERSDYKITKERVFSLKTYIDAHVNRHVLTHIDAIPDNFLMVGDEIRLIAWEYAGMQDPHVDIAMFAIYASYDRHQIDALIDIYFEDVCRDEIRVKIYCYISACGLLWSNWCEYKMQHGVEFGEYFHRQYQYAKDYYRIAVEEMTKIGEVHNEQG